jgi:uncharacterized protein YjiS (DUF1127 family)
MEAAMHQAERIAYPWTRALGDRLAALRRRVGAAIIAYAEARGRAAAVRYFERFSDRTLKDIGLERDQIHAAIYGEPR